MSELCAKFLELVSSSTNDAADGNSISASMMTVLKDLTVFAEASLENQLLLGQNKEFIEVLCNILSKSAFAEDVHIMEAMLWLVVRICRRTLMKATACPSNCEIIVAHNGCWQIIEGLSVHVATSAEVSYVACYAVMILASDSLARQVALANAGAPLALAAILFKYSQDPKVAEMCCRATRNMAINDEIGALMVGEGICEGLIAVLNSNSKNDGSSQVHVAEAALWAVVNLSSDAKVSTLFGSKGIFDPLMTLFGIYIDNPDIVGVLCKAFRNLLSESNFNVSIIYNIKEPRSICSLLCEVLRKYPCSFCPPGSVNNNSISSEEDVDDSLYESILWATANLSGVKQFAHEMMEIFDVKGMVYNLLLFNQQYLDDLQFDDDDVQGEVIESSVYLLRNLITFGNEESEGGSKSNKSTAINDKTLLTFLFELFNKYSIRKYESPDYSAAPYALAEKKTKEVEEEGSSEKSADGEKDSSDKEVSSSVAVDDVSVNVGDDKNEIDSNENIQSNGCSNNSCSSSASGGGADDAGSSSSGVVDEERKRPPKSFVDDSIVVTGYGHRFLTVMSDFINSLLKNAKDSDRDELRLISSSNGPALLLNFSLIFENMKFDLEKSHICQVIESKKAVEFQYIDPSLRSMTHLQTYVTFAERILETIALTSVAKHASDPLSHKVKDGASAVLELLGGEIGSKARTQFENI